MLRASGAQSPEVPDHRTAESGFHIGHGAEGYDFEKVDTWEARLGCFSVITFSESQGSSCQFESRQ